jgi:hypothetical protein
MYYKLHSPLGLNHALTLYLFIQSSPWVLSDDVLGDWVSDVTVG